MTSEQARTFVGWSMYPGFRYWKIDGGDTEDFNSFQAKREIDPELVLEYVTGAGGNLNPGWDKERAAYPSVYEVGVGLRKALRRVHDILKQSQQNPENRAVLNVQDDCNTAIGLGVLVASKRHPNEIERTYRGRDLHHQLSGPRHMQRRIDEVRRFGRWSLIATEGRVTSDHKWFESRAKVKVKIKDAVQLIDCIGPSAGTPNDISTPGLVLRLDGDKLPVAGDDFASKNRARHESPGCGRNSSGAN